MDMVPVCLQTLIMTTPPAPSVLVLCPTEEFDRKRTRRIVPIWVGPAEAIQLGAAIELSHGIPLTHIRTRPMTHDLFLDALTNLDATVEEVGITHVEGRTFHAELTLHQHGRLIRLDARPSDAVSLALREDAPITMAKDVLDKASFPYVFNSKETKEREMDEFRNFVQTLSPDDFEGWE